MEGSDDHVSVVGGDGGFGAASSISASLSESDSTGGVESTTTGGEEDAILIFRTGFV